MLMSAHLESMTVMKMPHVGTWSELTTVHVTLDLLVMEKLALVSLRN